MDNFYHPKDFDTIGKLFLKIEGDENTVMGLPVKKIKQYINSYK